MQTKTAKRSNPILGILGLAVPVMLALGVVYVVKSDAIKNAQPYNVTKVKVRPDGSIVRPVDVTPLVDAALEALKQRVKNPLKMAVYRMAGDSNVMPKYEVIKIGKLKPVQQQKDYPGHRGLRIDWREQDIQTLEWRTNWHIFIFDESDRLVDGQFLTTGDE